MCATKEQKKTNATNKNENNISIMTTMIKDNHYVVTGAEQIDVIKLDSQLYTSMTTILM